MGAFLGDFCNDCRLVQTLMYVIIVLNCFVPLQWMVDWHIVQLQATMQAQLDTAMHQPPESPILFEMQESTGRSNGVFSFVIY